MEKIQYFNGRRFIRDNKTGYYLACKSVKFGKTERIHRYVWSYHNGDIPKGCHIHHIDHDKSNNNIDNLMLINEKDHQSLHSKEYHINNREKVLQHMDSIRDKTKEWHASEAGNKWHKAHYENMKDKLHVKTPMNCEHCNDPFMGITQSRVCSNKCKSALRRKSGVDLITKLCEICKNEFRTSKYESIRCCSKQCGAQLRKDKKNITVKE